MIPSLSRVRQRAARAVGRSQPRRRLTCVLGDLDLGGVARLYTDLLTQLVRDGRRCRIVAPDGPLRDQLAGRGIDWEPIDWNGPRLTSLRHLDALLDADEPALVVADPRTSHVVASVAARGPLTCAFHTAPELMDVWLGERPTEQFAGIIRSLHGPRDVRVLTIGETYRDRYLERFGWAPASVTVLPPAIDVDAFPFAEPAPDPDLLLCLARLSPEKRAHIECAVKLVRARRAAGRDARLRVVGDGPWRSEAEALCADQLPPGSFEFLGATRDPAAALRRAGVVVASGLTALEAASTGRRVVIARSGVTGDEAIIGPVFAPETFDELAAGAFGGWFRPPTQDPDGAWSRFDAMGPETLAALRERVVREHSLPTAARVLADVMSRPAPHPPQPELRGAAEYAASIQDELRDSRRIADEIWAARMQVQAELDALRDADAEPGPEQADSGG